MFFFVCFVQEVQFESPVCGFSKYIYSVSQVLKEHFPLKKKRFMYVLASNWEYSFQPASSFVLVIVLFIYFL